MAATSKTEQELGAAPGAAFGRGHAETFEIAGEVVTLFDPGGPVAEAFNKLRNHVLAAHLRLGRRSLAICGASPASGCSFTAANLAVAVAQAGVKTLLIDGNLRDPGLGHFFRWHRGSAPGLVQSLSKGASDFGYSIENEITSNLSYMPAGGVADNPQALLASAEFRSMIDSCLRDFDLTIVDTPAGSLGDDSRRIASLLKYALLVVRREETRLADVKRLVADLRASGAEVIGTVLNDF